VRGSRRRLSRLGACAALPSEGAFAKVVQGFGIGASMGNSSAGPLAFCSPVSEDGTVEVLMKSPVADSDSEKDVSGSARLIYIERTSTGTGGAASIASDNSSSSIVTMQVTRVVQKGSIFFVPPVDLVRSDVEGFHGRLQASGIDTSKWGKNGAKSVDHLYWEAYHQRACILIFKEGTVKRVTRLVKIRLKAEIFGMEYTLFSRLQVLHDGQFIERKQVPLRKLQWKNHEHGDQSDEHYAENSTLMEDWRAGCSKALRARLGLSQGFIRQHLEEDIVAYSYHTDDNVQSDGYPGLPTLYGIHEVTLQVRDPQHPQVQIIGLPHGQEFATTEGDFSWSSDLDQGLPIGTQLNIWVWQKEPPKKQKSEPRSPVGQKAAPETPTSANIISERSMRVDIPLAELPGLLFVQATKEGKAELEAVRKNSSEGDCPNERLREVMRSRTTDWARVRKMAQSIRKPKYTLKNFNEDLVSFPELNLYLLPDADGSLHTSAGRTLGDEYQRTVGAFFAIYWLMRLPIDGKDGFSFGVDGAWKVQQTATSSAEKRKVFCNGCNWDGMAKLLLDAGLIEEKRSLWGHAQMVVNEQRLVALLSLTAIHDIMKMVQILPTVQAQHESYHGYHVGDTIGDHDHALAYLMDFYPKLLPSFNDLPEEEKLSLKFTQCNLQFNHGWFVQAEGPPGAIFTKFREILIRDHKSAIKQKDVALYFVHWLTDLAGAEPTPLAGCEKFAVKFPMPVLNSFLRSFEFVQRIVDETETQVMEAYLKVRWEELTPSPGPLPSGRDAIAKMRLICMAQMNALPILKGFSDLAASDREVLAVEMSRTGCMGQAYSTDLAPAESQDSGPAFLVYYGPAFLQSLGTDCPCRRLAILAEVYRAAREMWPACVQKVSSSVIIRIDTIKGMSNAAIEGVEQDPKKNMLILLKHNESEAFIELSTKKKINVYQASGYAFQILDLCQGS